MRRGHPQGDGQGKTKAGSGVTHAGQGHGAPEAGERHQATPERPENKCRCFEATQFVVIGVCSSRTRTCGSSFSRGSLAQGAGGREGSALPRQPAASSAEGVADATWLLRNCLPCRNTEIAEHCPGAGAGSKQTKAAFLPGHLDAAAGTGPGSAGWDPGHGLSHPPQPPRPQERRNEAPWALLGRQPPGQGSQGKAASIADRLASSQASLSVEAGSSSVFVFRLSLSPLLDLGSGQAPVAPPSSTTPTPPSPPSPSPSASQNRYHVQ